MHMTDQLTKKITTHNKMISVLSNILSCVDRLYEVKFWTKTEKILHRNVKQRLCHVRCIAAFLSWKNISTVVTVILYNMKSVLEKNENHKQMKAVKQMTLQLIQQMEASESELGADIDDQACEKILKEGENDERK